MSSTVTTATVTTVTTMLAYGTLGLIVAATLFLLLLKKEVLTPSSHPFASTLRRVLNIAIVPLVIAFIAIMAINLMNGL
jgi:hypothetical protein